jgi:hypothetical protein
MSMSTPFTPPLRYRRPARPLRFPASEPEDEHVGETGRHLTLRTALWEILRLEVAKRHSIGSEQFVYFNARDPRRCCAPDVFVRRDVYVADIPTWKVWEMGAPDLAVEIVSASDKEVWTWEEKLERYHEAGVRELVRFDADAGEGERVQAWDRVEEDLVERVVEGDRTPCVTLALFWWCVAPVGDYPAGLRLARDAEGRVLLPTPEERIAALEAELARRS